MFTGSANGVTGHTACSAPGTPESMPCQQSDHRTDSPQEVGRTQFGHLLSRAWRKGTQQRVFSSDPASYKRTRRISLLGATWQPIDFSSVSPSCFLFSPLGSKSALFPRQALCQAFLPGPGHSLRASWPCFLLSNLATTRDRIFNFRHSGHDQNTQVSEQENEKNIPLTPLLSPLLMKSMETSSFPSTALEGKVDHSGKVLWTSILWF